MTLQYKIWAAIRLLFNSPGQFFLIHKRRMTRSNWMKEKHIDASVGDVKFSFDFEQSAMIKYMYTGSYEVDTFMSLNSILKRGDTFIDVGANIGYISALALNMVGKSGQVHAFEPIKKYFDQLQKIQKDNPNYRFFPNNAAISTKEGKTQIAINSSDNIGNNSMLIDSIESKEIEEINTLNLTNYLNQHKLEPSLIKIDTEGFEIEVLKSLSPYILDSSKKPIILCEVSPEVYSFLNQSTADIAKFLDEVDYHCYGLDNLSKAIDINSIRERVDLVFKPKS